MLGRSLGPAPERPPPHGSCIAVCATDAPLDPPAPAPRAAPAARPGPGRLLRARDGSGEIGLAFATSEPRAAVAELRASAALFAAAYEAAHEAVLNCLVAARPAERLDGTMQDAFPIDAVRQLARRRAPVARPA